MVGEQADKRMVGQANRRTGGRTNGRAWSVQRFWSGFFCRRDVDGNFHQRFSAAGEHALDGADIRVVSAPADRDVIGLRDQIVGGVNVKQPSCSPQ